MQSVLDRSHRDGSRGHPKKHDPTCHQDWIRWLHHGVIGFTTGVPCDDAELSRSSILHFPSSRMLDKGPRPMLTLVKPWPFKRLAGKAEPHPVCVPISYATGVLIPGRTQPLIDRPDRGAAQCVPRSLPAPTLGPGSVLPCPYVDESPQIYHPLPRWPGKREGVDFFSRDISESVMASEKPLLMRAIKLRELTS